MQINVGCEKVFDCPQPTPMILNLNVHFTRVSDLVGRDALIVDPPIPMKGYRDDFGNWCTRIVAPAGRTRVTSDAVVRDSGLPDVIVGDARQIAVADLPARQPVLRYRSPLADRVEPVRPDAARMGPRSGDLRLRPSPHHVRLSAGGQHPYGAGGLQRPGGRVP